MIVTFLRPLWTLCCILIWAMAGPVAAQGQFSSIARIVASGSGMSQQGEVLAIDLALSQPVPWRLRYLDEPPRLVIDFREVDFTGLHLDALRVGAGSAVTDMRAGPLRAGWTRMVVGLDRARTTLSAEMLTHHQGAASARLQLRLRPVDGETFRAEVARPDPPGWALPKPALTAAPRAPAGARPLVVVLDPGHGGLDPGAERQGLSEADLMLTFARDLKEVLLRRGVGQVILTRDEDVFIPLETRIALAHAAGADLFISLHADAASESRARGATIYTLADEASDEASAQLAERHDRDALMSGVDLTGQDDVIASVLMDMARRETAPRSARFAQYLLEGLRGAKVQVHKNPLRSAAFSVLKAPDIVSVLLEVGYMSSPDDLARLTSPEWRAQMAGGIAAAISAWAVEDAARSGLLRQ